MELNTLGTTPNKATNRYAPNRATPPDSRAPPATSNAYTNPNATPHFTSANPGPA